MDEMFRRWALEREAEFEREARKRRLAALAGPRPKRPRVRHLARALLRRPGYPSFTDDQPAGNRAAVSLTQPATKEA